MKEKSTLDELFEGYKGDFKNKEVEWGVDVGLERYWENSLTTEGVVKIIEAPIKDVKSTFKYTDVSLLSESEKKTIAEYILRNIKA